MYTNNLDNISSITYLAVIYVLFATVMSNPEILVVEASSFLHITFTYPLTMEVDELSVKLF